MQDKQISFPTFYTKKKTTEFLNTKDNSYFNL